MTRSADSSVAVVPTGVAGTMAAHITVGDLLATVVWPTIPVPYVGRDLACRPVDEPPFEWLTSLTPTGPRWWAVTTHRCETCQLPMGPWAVAELGHLTGWDLIGLAYEMAALAEHEPEWQRDELADGPGGDTGDIARLFLTDRIS